MRRKNHYRQFIFILFSCLVFVSPAKAYSILAHEAIIDASWNKNIQPLLLKKFPASTRADLKRAHAYAYGGSLVADMGYVPGGSPYFTNLLHYVRSGDFVNTIINEAQDVFEYAFALGALSHYWADKYGHEIATNPAIAKAYPKLQKKFGDTITYHDHHASHSQIELAYDVIQAYKGNYATTAFHHLIGFEINAAVLDRALQKTYGQGLADMFPNFDKSVVKFRWGVAELFPEIAKQAWRSDIDALIKSSEEVQRLPFADDMPEGAFTKSIKKVRSRGGILARTLATVLTALPKVGPLEKLKFKYPGVECEALYLRSMDSIMVNLNADLKRLEDGSLMLANIDFDTGKPSAVNEYALADAAYQEWLTKLKSTEFKHVTPAMRQDIAAFYHSPNKKPLYNEALVAEVLKSVSLIAAQ